MHVESERLRRGTCALLTLAVALSAGVGAGNLHASVCEDREIRARYLDDLRNRSYELLEQEGRHEEEIRKLRPQVDAQPPSPELPRAETRVRNLRALIEAYEDDLARYEREIEQAQQAGRDAAQRLGELDTILAAKRSELQQFQQLQARIDRDPGVQAAKARLAGDAEEG